MSNTTLWASFLIITPSVKVYFAGDSGYFIGYREIGRRYPGIDYVLMPTTAYRPRWFMHYAHMNIDEAIDAFADLKAYRFIPTQWGTFHLGDEPRATQVSNSGAGSPKGSSTHPASFLWISARSSR